MRAPVVVLVSGSGTLLQALLDAAANSAYAARVVAVGADRECAGLERARDVGVETFVERVGDHPSRADWDAALAARVAAYAPAFVVTAGFMKLLGPRALAAATYVNTHPALLPAFPGAHAVRDALAYGVRVTGTTCHYLDEGVDTGPIIDQRAVVVRPDDDEATLHERIKEQERRLIVEVVDELARGAVRS